LRVASVQGTETKWGGNHHHLIFLRSIPMVLSGRKIRQVLEVLWCVIVMAMAF